MIIADIIKRSISQSELCGVTFEIYTFENVLHLQLIDNNIRIHLIVLWNHEFWVVISLACNAQEINYVCEIHSDVRKIYMWEQMII